MSVAYVDGAELRRRRTENEWSQATVAELAGISTGHYRTLERGTGSCSLPALLRLAAVFGCPVDDLLTDRCQHPRVSERVRSMLNEFPELDAEATEQIGRVVRTAVARARLSEPVAS